jgi:hypothetical protein
VTISRRQFLQASAVAAGAVAAGVATPFATAQASSTRAWLIPRYGTFSSLIDTSLGGSPEVVNNALNQGTTWFSMKYAGAGPSTKNPIPTGYTGVAVLKFEAYQNGSTGLVDAINAGLPSWVQAVQYDAESWSQTPTIEQGAWLNNPHPNVSYAQLFTQTAHQRGLRVVLSPGNDLCNNHPNDAYPNDAPQYPVNSGETDYQAYVRYDLASAAQWLSPGDMYEYQAQVLELDTSTYQSITSQIAEQVAAISSGVTFLAGIGRTGATGDDATCDQLTAAATSVAGVAAGYWPNVDANATRVQTMICVLQNLGY